MYSNWSLRSIEGRNKYNKKIMNGGVCAGAHELISDTDCWDTVLPHFMKCYRHNQVDHELANVPLFHTIFSRPTPLLGELMSIIRRRVGLPELAPGLEPHPGAWGLRTPGYYILGMHFRNLPKGSTRARRSSLPAFLLLA